MKRVLRALLSTLVVAGGGLSMVAAAATPAAAVPATAVTLTASNTYVPEGTPVTLTATANGDLADNQYLDIYNITGGYLICDAVAPDTQCVDDETDYGTQSYQAYIDTDTNPEDFPPTGISATSNTVTVTWYPPPPAPRASDTYCSATPWSIDGTTGDPIFPIHRKLAVQTGDPTAVCVRIDAATFAGFGGALVVNGGSVGIPTYDGNMDACPTRPEEDTIFGKKVMVGYGSTSTDVSLCVQVDTTAIRVRIPTSGAPGIHFYEDDGGDIIGGGIGGGGISGSCGGSSSPNTVTMVPVPKLCIRS
jgi:hypothetical protein